MSTSRNKTPRWIWGVFLISGIIGCALSVTIEHSSDPMWRVDTDLNIIIMMLALSFGDE